MHVVHALKAKCQQTTRNKKQKKKNQRKLILYRAHAYGPFIMYTCKRNSLMNRTNKETSIESKLAGMLLRKQVRYISCKFDFTSSFCNFSLDGTDSRPLTLFHSFYPVDQTITADARASLSLSDSHTI